MKTNVSNPVIHELNGILKECTRLQSELTYLEQLFSMFEKKIDQKSELDSSMIQEYISLKKYHLRTKWVYLKITNRRRKFKEKYNL